MGTLQRTTFVGGVDRDVGQSPAELFCGFAAGCWVRIAVGEAVTVLALEMPPNCSHLRVEQSTITCLQGLGAIDKTVCSQALSWSMGRLKYLKS